MHLDLAMRLGLEAFDDDKIDPRHLRQQFGQPRLGGPPQFMHQGPSPAGGHQHLRGARLPVHPGILARHVDIETVVGVLDDGNAKTFFKKIRDDTRQQRRLAGAAPPGEANHFHLILRAAGGTGLCFVQRCFISANRQCHASLRMMMKIDKAPVPLIVPNPHDPRLTERVAGTDQTGAAVEINVPVERPLTLYLNAQEIVTMMTIGDYPEYLALGYLLNQNMLKYDDVVTEVEYDDDLQVVVVRTEHHTNFEQKLK